MAYDDEWSRRELLKQTGATLTALALGGACSSGADEAAGTDAPGAAAGGGTAGPDAVQGPSTNAGTGHTAGSGGGGGGAAAGTGASPGIAGGNSQPTDAGAAPAPDAGGAMTDAGPGDSRVVAAAVHAADVDAAVARAVALAGGIEAIQPGQSVFIKVNAVSNRSLGTPGIRTSNAVLAAVVRLVKARDPGRIVVGDRSARQFDSTDVFESTGMAEAAIAAGADEVYMAPSSSADPSAWMLVQPPGYEATWQSASGILAMRKILEADHLINVPACKNHRYVLFTMSMKNFVGAIGDSSRDPLHFAETIAANFTPIGRDIAVLNQPFSPLINVIDATTALINGGPQGDGADAVRTSPGLILASRDRIAADALGLSLIKLELGRTTVAQPDASHSQLTSERLWNLPQIVEGAARGLGVSGPEAVRLAFEDVADAAQLEQIFRS